MAKSSGPKMERVYSRIYQKIVRGEFPQGSRLIERDLAETLGVSRTVIREVIHKMAEDGLVEWNRADKHARPVVASLYEREMEELHEIVAALEALAVRRIASWPEKRRMRLARELRALNDKIRKLCQKKPIDIDKVLAADHDFHTTYSYLGAGPRVAALRRAIRPQAERYARAYMPAFDAHHPVAIKEHEEIIHAIEAGEPEAADEAVHRNWRNGSKRFSEALGQWPAKVKTHSGHA